MGSSWTSLKRTCGIGGTKQIDRVKQEVVQREAERANVEQQTMNVIAKSGVQKTPIVELFVKCAAAHVDYVKANLRHTQKFDLQWAAWHSKFLVRNWTKKVNKKTPDEKTLRKWLQQTYEIQKKKSKNPNLDVDSIPDKFARAVKLKLKNSY